MNIGDDVAIDTSTISPFAADAGAMILQPVALGKRSGVCCSCALGPGSSLAVGTCLGPLSSAHEPPCDEQSARNRKLCRPTFAAPPLWMQWVVGWPCMAFVGVMALMPYLLCLSLVNLMPNEYRYILWPIRTSSLSPFHSSAPPPTTTPTPTPTPTRQHRMMTVAQKHWRKNKNNQRTRASGWGQHRRSASHA